MKDIRKAENFKDLLDNCITSKERQSIEIQTDLILKMHNIRKKNLSQSVYKHKTIQERFVNYIGEYRGEELYWGEDVGEEVVD
jgi:hypothetical protein